MLGEDISGCQGFRSAGVRGNTREFLCGDGTVLCPDYSDSYKINFMK